MAPQGKLHWTLALVAIWSFALGGSDGKPASRDVTDCSWTCVHGYCISGTCVCNFGYRGPSCSEDCRRTCVHGYCISGTCVCNFGYRGPSCGEAVCKPSCENGGSCIGPYICLCAPGYTGMTCDLRDCKSPCVHGICVSGKCFCSSGYTGPNCSEADCKSPCVHGSCMSGKCFCDSGYTGPNCSEDCKRTCVHGSCMAGGCFCDSGYKGPSCNEATWIMPVILACSIGVPFVCISVALAVILTVLKMKRETMNSSHMSAPACQQMQLILSGDQHERPMFCGY